MKKRITCILLSIIMIIVVVDPVWATTISDIKKEEESPTKELKDTKTNITEVSNLDQTDGKPVKIEIPAKIGRTTLVRKPRSKQNNGESNNINTNKESFLYLNLVDLNIEKNNI